MTITKTINLDFAQKTQNTTVFAKQNDNNARIIEIIPLVEGKPFKLEDEIEVRLQITKPSGRKTINGCYIENGEKIIAVLEQKNLDEQGMAIADIALYKENNILSSQIFYIDIEKTAYSLISADKDEKEEHVKSNPLLAAIISAAVPKKVDIYAEELEDLIGTVRSRAFMGCTTIRSIQFPESVNVLNKQVFQSSSIEKIEALGVILSIGTNAFNDCKYLKTLILRGERVVSLADTTLIGSPIANDEGYIFVPREYIESYKVATNWITFENRFRAVEDYDQIINYISRKKYTVATNPDYVVYNILSTFDIDKYPEGFTAENMINHIESSGGLSAFDI